MPGASAGPSEAMLQAMEELWRLHPTEPDNIRAAPAFVRLREACCDSYTNSAKSDRGFALSTALRALGLPCALRREVAHLAAPVDEAAKGLDAAFRTTHARRLHLAPLDLAGDILPLAFGPARVKRFTPAELREMIDEPRLKRMYRNMSFDADRFSEFHWLVVKEKVALDQDPEARAMPLLNVDLSQDFGRIEPHERIFPPAFEEALFFLVLAPWESWSTMQEVDWRGFRVPWVYTADSDIFVRPNVPASPASLRWEHHIHDNGYGGTVEVERPMELQLRDEAKAELAVWNQEHWVNVERAKKSVLFETPVVHFFLRAFLADGVDEFLAHITMIEAALGLQADYQGRSRNAPDRHKNMSPTKRMRGRIAGLLGDRSYADRYKKLFDVRSAFLHGRKMDDPISTDERVLARSLARQVVEGLISASRTGPIASRAGFLDDLLD